MYSIALVLKNVFGFVNTSKARMLKIREFFCSLKLWSNRRVLLLCVLQFQRVDLV